jgi:hypothetical protein
VCRYAADLVKVRMQAEGKLAAGAVKKYPNAMAGLLHPSLPGVTRTITPGCHQLDRVLAIHPAPGCTHSRVSDWLRGAYRLSHQLDVLLTAK